MSKQIITKTEFQKKLEMEIAQLARETYRSEKEVYQEALDYVKSKFEVEA